MTTANPPPPAAKKTFAEAAAQPPATSSASSKAASVPPTTQKKDDSSSAGPLTGPATAQEISFATVLGACSGYTCKKIAKGSALLIGIAFMSLQALAYTGVISINWKKIEDLFVKRLDMDGDGKLSMKDFQVMGYRLVHNLTRSLPSAGGFSAAFFLGFRYG
ncbi:FUN14 family-domain-containing protein [Obelidium mucronatum]|nr:FUN14 family-domain-containing protein [Obelidium mucronatum]